MDNVTRVNSFAAAETLCLQLSKLMAEIKNAATMDEVYAVLNNNNENINGFYRDVLRPNNLIVWTRMISVSSAIVKTTTVRIEFDTICLSPSSEDME